MEIRTCVTKQEWGDALAEMQSVSFLQSWDWGVLKSSAGHRVLRHILMHEGKACAAVQWIEMQLSSGLVYWFAPYGPVARIPATGVEYAQLLHELLHLSARAGKDSRPVFLRIEPRVDLCAESIFLIVKSQERLRLTSSVQPADTRILNLDQDEHTLLEAMHQKTRYNIRLAEKKGIRIVTGDSYIDDFIRLNHDTSMRDGFVSHPDEHYMNMITFLPQHMREVYAAEWQGKIIAANILIHFNHVTTYLHGASSSEFRNLMAPHLLQWRQIVDAKSRGSYVYDFYGIAPSHKPSIKSDSWQGITRFKNGFCGIEKNYVGTWDLPIRKFWYSLYSVVRSIRH
ncbi:MAG: peptidoglycan bridge formation glycyltransferase FemA/FemB family protein [Patescibacteria group bacterium]